MIRVLLSDPTDVDAEALMRSVGTDLEGCTAVDQRAGGLAGPEVLDRLEASAGLPIGGALVSPGGGLRTPLLIHVVVRSTEEPISEDTVARAFRNGLRQAAQWQVSTLVVPPLGIGAGNLDAEVSARVMCNILWDHEGSAVFPRNVVITVSNAYEEEVFKREVSRVFDAEGLESRLGAATDGFDSIPGKVG